MQPLNVLSRLPSRFPLRVTLIVPFLVIIFIAVTLTGFLSLASWRTSGEPISQPITH
jgi:hypothetical protein